jgi:hypothetical protein
MPLRHRALNGAAIVLCFFATLFTACGNDEAESPPSATPDGGTAGNDAGQADASSQEATTTFTLATALGATEVTATRGALYRSS